MACRRTKRRLTGSTPANFAAILTAKKPDQQGDGADQRDHVDAEAAFQEEEWREE